MSADAEGAAPITVVERIDQFVIRARVLLRVEEVGPGRLTRCAAGGADGLRQLHEGFADIEQGHVFHLDGGGKRVPGTRNDGDIRAARLRADARVHFLPGAST